MADCKWGRQVGTQPGWPVATLVRRGRRDGSTLQPRTASGCTIRYPAKQYGVSGRLAAAGPPELEWGLVQETTADSIPGAAVDAVVTRRSAVAPNSKRWGVAVLAAAGLGLPLGWLLCYGALLPFFLGLFFFLLFGLLLGAVMYRLGGPARPLARGRLVLGTVVVVAVTWTVSMLVEGYDFPSQMADKAISQHRRLPEGVTTQTFRRESAADVARHLREQYAPGGAIGYMRWALSSSRLDRGVGQLRKPYQAAQYRWWWALRVVLSIGLLAFGIHSQVGPLTREARANDRAARTVNPLSKM
ncbi:MAG: hypothetical protein ACYSVY_14500 [Planctomycetota bacterium]